MTEAEIKDKVYEIIVSKMGVNKDQIKLESKFSDDLGADSLDTVELIMELESEVCVQIPDEDAERMNTVDDIIRYVANKTNRDKENKSLSKFTSIGKKK